MNRTPEGQERRRKQDAVRAKARRAADPEGERVRQADLRSRRTTDQRHERALRSLYGLTAAQFAALVADQAGACAICLKVPAGRLCVDHDHTTGKVRQLLCRRCNSALGLFDECPETLARAKSYLERHV